MTKAKTLLKSLIGFLSGKREITFYFQTIRVSDSLLALWYSLALFLGFPSGKNGRRNFLNEVKKKFDYRAAFLYGSARSALCALLKSLELAKDSEVIVTGFTCDVVPNAVIQAGYKPVYADIYTETFCTSPESVRQRITEKTKVIIIQHTFGIPADIDSLMTIADDHSLYVIEDSAVSLGSQYKNQLTGTFGDAAIFSFELSKTITSCRGGMLFINTNKRQAITRHKKFYQAVPEQSVKYASNILFQLGLSGILYRPVIYNLGKYIAALMFKLGIFKKSTPDSEKQAKLSKHYMLKLSDQQAMLLSRQWKKLEQIRMNRQKISLYYYENLKGITGIVPLPIQSDTSLNLIRYPLLVDNRRKLLKAFQDNRIELGLWFTAPISSPSIKHRLFGYAHGECPIAEEIAGKICNLPTHLKLKRQEADRIIALLKTGEMK